MVEYLEGVLKYDLFSGWRNTREKLRAFFNKASAVDCSEQTDEVDCNEKPEKMDWQEKLGRKWFY